MTYILLHITSPSKPQQHLHSVYFSISENGYIMNCKTHTLHCWFNYSHFFRSSLRFLCVLFVELVRSTRATSEWKRFIDASSKRGRKQMRSTLFYSLDSSNNLSKMCYYCFLLIILSHLLRACAFVYTCSLLMLLLVLSTHNHCRRERRSKRLSLF